MDAYSPSHPTDQDMDVDSDSAPTPEQDAHCNQLSDSFTSNVVPLLFQTDIPIATVDSSTTANEILAQIPATDTQEIPDIKDDLSKTNGTCDGQETAEKSSTETIWTDILVVKESIRPNEAVNLVEDAVVQDPINETAVARTIAGVKGLDPIRKVDTHIRVDIQGPGREKDVA
ncbi:unnamed protein product, partial [Echinostoma caproni]|uniref:Uncharacterized protein n=1 Tax=Echinostoma caproni TaxID=27848 RepID=A0A183A4J0_9TREM